MNRTGIEWCDYTWNPIVGCSPASEGCRNCYAKVMARRLAANPKMPDMARSAYGMALALDGKQWANPPCLTLLYPRLDEPIKVKKPARIFVCSMSDFYHENVCGLWRSMILETIEKCPQHTFMFLTKRPENIPEGFAFPKNVWLGVSIENQARADERIPMLLKIPAAVRFVSVEPMLGPVKLSERARAKGWCGCGECGNKDSGFPCPTPLHGVDWVIAGPETGTGARECKDEWIDALEAESPCFFDKRKLAGVRREWPAGRSAADNGLAR